MSFAGERPATRKPFSDESRELAVEWRKLGRAATVVAVLTSPATDPRAGLAVRLGAARDLPVRHRLPRTGRRRRAPLHPARVALRAEKPLLEEDVVARRRVRFWRTKWKRWTWILGSLFGVLLVVNAIHRASAGDASLGDTLSMLAETLPLILVQFLPYVLLFPMLFSSSS